MLPIPPFRERNAEREPRSILNDENRFFATVIGAAATLASFEEIVTAPKPGLVDPLHSGSHDDMSWITFLRSASVLAPFWSEQASEGLRCADTAELMPKLRGRGVEMERVMFESTDGVNTHKGLVFALSLLAGAAGNCLSAGSCAPAEICRRAAEIASPSCLRQFETIRGRSPRGASSHGETIFLRHGVGGIRKEAMDGFPTLLSYGLPALEMSLASGASLNDAALASLLTIMSRCEDTNVIHRAGFEFWRGRYKEAVALAVSKFDPARPGGYEALGELENLLLAYRASPGGAADLLACTLFLYRSKIPDDIFSLRRKVEP